MQTAEESCQRRQCRACLSTENELLHIFDEGFREILELFSGFQVTLKDCLPKYICVECGAVLEKFTEFRKKCKTSYEYLLRGHVVNQINESSITNHAGVKLEVNESHSQDVLKIEYDNDTNAPVNDSIEIKRESIELNQNKNDSVVESQSKIDWKDLLFVKDSDINHWNSERSVDLKSESKRLNESFVSSDSSKNESVPRSSKAVIGKERTSKGPVAKETKNKGVVKRVVRKKIYHMDSVDPTKIEKSRLSMEEQKAELVKKSQSEDYLNAPYKCKDCFKYFLYEDNYNDHLRTRHDESIGPYLCTLCQSRFKAKGTLTSHAYKHSVIFRCLACSVTYKKCVSAEEHYKIAHEGMPPTLVCHLCGKISKSSHAQTRHMKLSHSKAALVRIQCTICPATFLEKNHFKAHMRYHSDVKPFKCDICGNTYHFKDTMLKHRLMHSDEKNFYCAVCDLSYRCQRFLDKHLKDSPRHGGKKQDRFNCGICRTSFTVQSEMFKHKEREHGIVFKPKKKPEGRNHQCDTCGKAFSTNVTLKSHLRTHTGERPFSCVTCGRAFTQRSAMQTHVKLVHLNMKWSDLVKRKAKKKEENTMGTIMQ